MKWIYKFGGDIIFNTQITLKDHKNVYTGTCKLGFYSCDEHHDQNILNEESVHFIIYFHITMQYQRKSEQKLMAGAWR